MSVHPCWPIITTEIKGIVISFSINKSPELDGSNVQFQETFKQKLTSMLFTLFHKTVRKRTPLYEANITLLTKLDKDNNKKENYRFISLMNIGISILKDFLLIRFKSILERP